VNLAQVARKVLTGRLHHTDEEKATANVEGVGDPSRIDTGLMRNEPTQTGMPSHHSRYNWPVPPRLETYESTWPGEGSISKPRRHETTETQSKARPTQLDGF
jgi:hypothetical protein